MSAVRGGGPLEADLDGPDPADRSRDGSGPAPDGGPRHGRALLAAVAAAALVVGALGGSLAASEQARGRLDDAVRVVVAVESSEAGQDDLGAPAPVGDDLVLVTVSVVGPLDAGEEVVVEAIDTPIGPFALFPAVRLRAGLPAQRTLLRGRVDCAAVADRQAGGEVYDGRLLAGSTATLERGPGRTTRAGVLVANPDRVLSPVVDRCVSAAVASAAAEGDDTHGLSRPALRRSRVTAW